MKLSGSYQINLEKQKVWEALNDPDILQKTIPGCEKFVKNSPYSFWDIIWLNNERIGNIYLTDRDELGIFIKKKFQSRGSGSIALQKFLKKTGKNRFLAHINPTNYKSIQFFGKNGFTHIQNTYHKKINS